MEVTQKEWQKNGAISVHCHRTMLIFLTFIPVFKWKTWNSKCRKCRGFVNCKFFSSQHFILLDPDSLPVSNKTGIEIRKYKHCALPAHRKSHPCLTPTPSSSSPCAASEFARLSKGSAAAPDRSVVCLCNACSGVPEAGGYANPPPPLHRWNVVLYGSLLGIKMQRWNKCLMSLL